MAAKALEGKNGKKYTWVLSPRGMHCYKSKESWQTVTNLWEVGELTPFHDAELARATKEINGILSSLEKSNKDSSRKLSFIRFRNRHFLVWAQYAVSEWDEEKNVIKELRLKTK